MTDSEQARLKEESDELHRQTNVFFSLWSALESNLALLLCEILNIDYQKSKIGFAVYYSPTSFDARQTIVGNCLTNYIRESKNLDELQPLWERLNDRISRLRRKRNTIAHGSIGLVYYGAKNYMRILLPMFDFRDKEITANSIPGLSINDMKNVIRNLGLAIQCVEKFTLLVGYHQLGRSTWRKILAELQGYLRPDDGPPQGDQTPPRP